MREIVFDTETTGLDPRNDRIVEVGCVELENFLPTGREFQMYINPERSVSEATVRITGITNETLRGKPLFRDVCDDLLAFIGDAPIIAHNANFDCDFLNSELQALRRQQVPRSRFIDTVALAREVLPPGSRVSLDAVCKQFNISIEGRELHGALKDAKLLAMVYLELKGGRERRFEFGAGDRAARVKAMRTARLLRPVPLSPRITAAEEAAHIDFISGLGPEAVWKKYA